MTTTRDTAVESFPSQAVWAGAALAGLIPGDCRSAGVSTAVPAGATLPPAEWDAVKHACAERQAEFAAGRAAARSALRALGAGEPVIPVASDRSPCWPAGVVGSIAHTHGIALAAVAPASEILSIGIDIEETAAVKPELWAEFLSPLEGEAIGRLDPGVRQQAAAAIFTAKEAFFKFQYPLTRAWLDFHDARVSPDLDRQTCAIQLRRPILIGRTPVARFESRFAADPRWTLAAITLPA